MAENLKHEEDIENDINNNEDIADTEDSIENVKDFEDDENDASDEDAADASETEKSKSHSKKHKKKNKNNDSKKKESYATFQYDVKTYFKGNVQAFFTRRFNMFMVFFAMFLCIYSVMRAMQNPEDIKLAVASVVMVAAFLLFLYPLMLYIESYRMVNKNSVFSKQVRFSFSQAGIRFSAPGESITYNWTEMKKVKETRNYIIFTMTYSRTTFVPKEHLNADQLANLRTEIRRRMNARDYLLYR